MSAQHTPGPWFIWQELAMQREGCGPEEITDRLLDNADHSIYAGNPKECTRGSMKGHTSHICDVDADTFDFDDDEDAIRSKALANARLIAAAPDMLAALIVAREFVSTDRNSLADASMAPDGSMAPMMPPPWATMTTALLQIDAAIQKATRETK